ncbi:uncharacterized protein BJ171DRAFT_462530 [Polychytrium aggregatum]|uniref:uncharacterized protein n=1 Tax=Polychytrium aggregatum TaxID=110093 RepID=UPI0022FF3F86|nr:uncharacterized protein BJ171DRAFT_462530 [Polychytrium aggregatum]KAI9199401.1 hypothetical protein BJ171DRAFT_462530 [Polychytrium aggregatum]
MSTLLRSGRKALSLATRTPSLALATSRGSLFQIPRGFQTAVVARTEATVTAEKRKRVIQIFDPTTELIEASEISKIAIPEGVSTAFGEHYRRMVMGFQKADLAHNALRVFSYQIASPRDAEIFATLLKQWRATGHSFSKGDSLVVLESLWNAGAYDTILELWCDRPSYNMVFGLDYAHRLMRSFQTEALAKGVSEEAHIAALDKLYKTFAVALSYDYPPTSETYAILISTGAYGRTSEGWRRSLVTAKEQISLGLPFTPESTIALVDGYLKTGLTKEAASLITSERKRLPALRALDLFQIQVALASQNYVQAIEAYTQLKANDAPEDSAVFGSWLWESEAQVVDKLIQALAADPANETMLKKVESLRSGAR